MNWTIIDEAAVRTGKISLFLDTAQSIASSRNEADPLPEMIADVVATVRAAISTGNALDLDTTKIPNSLKALALRMVLRRVKDYCEQPLSDDEKTQAKEDQSYLNRIMDQKIRFETPDTAAASSEMQGGSAIEAGTTNLETLSAQPNFDPTRIASRDRLSGL